MDVLRIRGQKQLSGRVTISGSKNSALPIMAAALLADGTTTLEGLPEISDILSMGRLLESMGAEVQHEGTTWKITPKNLHPLAPYDMVRKMRASICLLGPLVARLRKAHVSMPGGCVIGPRPIDMHLKGLRSLGCRIETAGGKILVDASQARGNRVFLGGRHGSTVLGTANIVMAATLIPGVTLIESAACEPEIVDLCEFLNKMGAKISGMGSPTIEVTGVEQLHPTQHRVIPDRIEAGTFVIASLMTRSPFLVENCRPAHLASLIDCLEGTGATFPLREETRLQAIPPSGDFKPVDIVTHPHPGFPTDLQAQMCAMLSLIPGISIVTEKVFPNRFMHVPELQRMGASIAIEGPSAIIHGSPHLSGAPVMASDLRASAALILAGLLAKGESWILRIYHLDRGYQEIHRKLQNLGADIERLSDKEVPDSVVLE